MIRQIRTEFEGANATVRHVHDCEATLTINPDPGGGWSQWFNFRVEADPGTELTLTIVDADQCTYADGWEDFRAFVQDSGDFARIATEYRDGALTIRHRMATSSAEFAYFPSYDSARLDRWLRHLPADVEVGTLGGSSAGRPIHHLRIGNGPRHVWIVGRQHSGETMASWWMEGALETLTARPFARDHATFHIVPLANPDGAAMGHLRANGQGQDLNRSWVRPGVETPESGLIRAAMEAMGAQFVLDVHGDEMARCVFVDGPDRRKTYSDERMATYEAFIRELSARCPAFDPRAGYAEDYGGSSSDGMLARTAWRDLNAVGVTLEMPFHCAVRAGSDGAALAREIGSNTIETLFHVLDLCSATIGER